MASPPHSPNPNPNPHISSTNNGKKDSKSGCQVPFVAAGEGSSLTRFKQLSTRRGGRPRTKQRTVSSPGLVSEGFEVLGEPNLVGIGQPFNDNAPLVSAHLPLHWTAFSDATEDHPGHRRGSGFFQPIRHLSGNLQKATSH